MLIDVVELPKLFSLGLFQKLKNISSKIMEMSDILLIEPVSIDEICCLD